MTKEQYFEMCRVLNEEPVEEDIPVDESELCDESALALRIYRYLPDNWAAMTGHYLGKELTSLSTILNVFEIEDKELTRTILYLIKIIDEEVSKIVSARIKAESEAAEAKSKASGRRGR